MLEPVTFKGVTKVWVTSEGTAPFGLAPVSVSATKPRVKMWSSLPWRVTLVVGSIARTLPPASW